MGNNSSKAKVKVKAKKKAIKPKMGKGTGGLFTARIIADVKSRKKTMGKTIKHNG